MTVELKNLNSFCANGAVSNVDSAMSLGHCLTKRYPELAPKLEGRVCKYLLVLPA